MSLTPANCRQESEIPALRLREAGNDQVSTIAYLFRIVLLSEDIEEVVAGADLNFSSAALFAGGVYRILCTGSFHLLVVLSNVLRFPVVC